MFFSSDNQGLKPISSVLASIFLAFFIIITRPGLSSAFALPNGQPGQQAVPYTLIGPGESAGCSVYIWRDQYRWICTDNLEGDDRNKAVLPDSDGVARFTVYYNFQGPDQGVMAPEYSTPLSYQDYRVFTKNFPNLYTTYDGGLATPPGPQILMWTTGSNKIQPWSPKSYKGKAMKNPYWLSHQKRMGGNTSQLPLLPQEDDTTITAAVAALTPSSSPSPSSFFPADEFQLSSVPSPLDTAAASPPPLDDSDTLPPSPSPSPSLLPDSYQASEENTNAGADISGGPTTPLLAANAHAPGGGSMDTALGTGGNDIASIDLTDSGLWE